MFPPFAWIFNATPKIIRPVTIPNGVNNVKKGRTPIHGKIYGIITAADANAKSPELSSRNWISSSDIIISLLFTLLYFVKLLIRVFVKKSWKQ